MQRSLPDKGADTGAGYIESRVVGADNQLFWLSAGTAAPGCTATTYEPRDNYPGLIPEQELTLATDGHAFVWIEFSPMGRYPHSCTTIPRYIGRLDGCNSAPDYNFQL